MPYPVRKRDWTFSVLLLVLLYAWTVVQKLLFAEVARPFTLLAGALVLLLLFFAVVKPLKPYELARFLCFWLGSAAAFILLIQHVIIRFDLSYRAAIVLAVAVGGPYLTALLYQALKHLHSEPLHP